jgi:hypothetical protein
MKRPAAFGAAVAGLLCLGTALAADLKSGLQPGQSPAPFNPLNVTGRFAGKSQCLV